MKLRAFKIRNFRSIVDSGWNQLATDNITGIIGQNESGKTSILEALESFYNGFITDDMLRSDLSLPVVSCSFQITADDFCNFLKEKAIPEIVIKQINASQQVTLTRTWNPDKSSYLTFGDETILADYKEKQVKKKEFENRIQADVEKIIQDAQKAEGEFSIVFGEKEQIQRDKTLIEQKLSKQKKSFDRQPTQENRKKLEKLIIEEEQLKRRLEKKDKVVDTKSSKAAELSEKAKYALLCKQGIDELEKIRLEWENTYHELIDLKRIFENLEDDKDKVRLQTRLDSLNSSHLDNSKQLQQIQKKSTFRKYVTAQVFKGADPREAEELVNQDFENEEKYYSEQELANETFKYIPIFELFEDFSSLLPNRIDLDDIFEENISIEGYKAATNFLIVSGLSKRFFLEQNDRILKHKIEKLNSELSLNFQEYWRQSLNKQNKIKLNFELEHYDFNHPDKKGRPYIEFWIKDDEERLYPKQRSRGVRWFLSFYLELKASSIAHKDRSRVFLIDEPGLSLHARAQEDVLEVFEDIKEDIQIVYSTHSPHLINLNKLYRLLAVQRAVEEDYKSETVIYDANSLKSASTDTLSPIYTLMGTKLSDHQFIKKRNNVIVEDTCTYYYLTAIFKLVNYKKPVFFLPATNVESLPTLANLLLGWKLEFIVLLDDDPEGNKVYSHLKLTLFGNDEKKTSRKIVKIDGMSGIEDIFSTLDFKNFVLHKRVGITESNSEYIRMNNLSREILASEFTSHLQEQKTSLKDFDDETQEKIKDLVARIDELLS